MTEQMNPQLVRTTKNVEVTFADDGVLFTDTASKRAVTTSWAVARAMGEAHMHIVAVKQSAEGLVLIQQVGTSLRPIDPATGDRKLASAPPWTGFRPGGQGRVANL